MRVLTNQRTARRGRTTSAFTMVEIALSIAVVAFALVAILGVLPTGMTVQKDNRDDNIINQEGRYWLEAISSGAIGLEDLTNYVESISITNVTQDKVRSVVFDNTPATPLQPVDVIALLSTPKYAGTDPDDRATNRVAARVKALTGPAAEKGPLTNQFSFRYEMQVEITPIYPGIHTTNELAEAVALTRNLQELRVIMRWPVVERGNGWFVGNNRKTFRGRVAGTFELETNVTRRVSNLVKSTLGGNLVTLARNKFNVARD